MEVLSLRFRILLRPRMLHSHIAFGVTLIALSAVTNDRRRFDNFMDPALGRQASDL